MGKMAEFDYSEFRKMAESFNKVDGEKIIGQWVRELLIELAFRAERKIKKRTPVGVYKNKTGGHLRRNWQVGEIKQEGNSYTVEIFNNVEYASYVEYGHRTRDHSGWVEGRFMATISIDEIERELPSFIAQKQEILLNKLLNGK